MSLAQFSSLCAHLVSLQMTSVSVSAVLNDEGCKLVLLRKILCVLGVLLVLPQLLDSLVTHLFASHCLVELGQARGLLPLCFFLRFVVLVLSLWS